MTRAKADWQNAAPPGAEARLISFSSGGGFHYFRALFMAAKWIRQKLPPDPLPLASDQEETRPEMTKTRTVSYRQEHQQKYGPSRRFSFVFESVDSAAVELGLFWSTSSKLWLRNSLCQ